MTPPAFALGEIFDTTGPEVAAFLAQHPAGAELVINSPGGCAYTGAALMAEVERHGRVTVRVRGLAASAATLPMVAAWRVLIHPAAMVMIHDPAALTGGTARDLRAAADGLDKIAGTYAEAYARHTGHPAATVRAWMQAETWLTAAEAVELGFCDEIEPDSTAAPTVARFDYTRFKAAPDHLRRLAEAHGWAAVPPVHGKE